MFACLSIQGVTACGFPAAYFPFTLRLKGRAVFVSIAVIVVRGRSERFDPAPEFSVNIANDADSFSVTAT